jgi:hypothetical protein
MIALALTLSLMVPTEADLLRGIRAVESNHVSPAPDGDLNLPYCQHAIGAYQIRPIAVRELVRVGALEPMAGFSMGNCSGIRKWLRVSTNNRLAAQLYLRLMMKRSGGDVEDALAAYNCGWRKEYPASCRRYAGQVLVIAGGE